MSQVDITAWFSEQLTAVQRELYAYILTLLPWSDQAIDVLQQTNLTLWRDAAKFQPGTNFRAWAYRVAYYQVLAQRRKTSRDHLQFDETLLKGLAEHASRDTYVAEDEALALRDCLGKLPEDERELIRRRYDSGATIKAIAADVGQSSNAITVRLHRIRRTLLDCIHRELSERDHG
jgi:RNA polymerase sigma-70 factor, ECF subfamily